MKDRFLVLDSSLYECGQFATLAAAVKNAQESAGADVENAYSGDETYYVAQILGKAGKPTTPKLAPYTVLPPLAAAKPRAKKAAAKKK